MTRYPTLKTLTLLDIAKLGVCYDEHTEKFRGTRYDGTLVKYAYEAAYRIVKGCPKFGDDQMVRDQYEERVKIDCFTKKGQLSSFFKREVYTSREERRRADAEAVKRMQERKERKLYEKLKKKYG